VTMTRVDEFLNMLMQEDPEDRAFEIMHFSKDARRIFYASMIADLTMTKNGLEDGTAEPPKAKDFQGLANFLVRMTKDSETDEHLVKRTASLYNAISAKMGFDVRVAVKADGTIGMGKLPPSPPKDKFNPPSF
jgi:hypothetical protein